MGDKLGVAVIGAGTMGGYHAEKYHRHPGVDLLAIVDRDASTAQALAAKYGCASYVDLDTLLAQLGGAGALQAVSIATPAESHHELALTCLRRGWHCFVEKPLCAQEDQADELLQLLESAAQHLIVQVGHSERLNPVVKAISTLDLRPHFITCERLGSFSGRALDTSVILDLMIHDIDLVLMLAELGEGEPEVMAKGIKVFSSAIDICTASLDFPSAGVMAQLAASRISDAKASRSLRALGNGFYISADLQKLSLELEYIERQHPSLSAKLEAIANKVKAAEVTTKLGKVRQPMTSKFRAFFAPADPVQEQVQAFVDAIGGKGSVITDAHAGARALRIACQVQERSSGTTNNY